MDPTKLTLEAVAAHIESTHAESMHAGNERLFLAWWIGEHAQALRESRDANTHQRNAALRQWTEAAFYAGMLAGLRRFP